jgi:hypothetical protein
MIAIKNRDQPHYLDSIASLSVDQPHCYFSATFSSLSALLILCFSTNTARLSTSAFSFSLSIETSLMFNHFIPKATGIETHIVINSKIIVCEIATVYAFLSLEISVRSRVRDVKPVAPASITACGDIAPWVALGIDDRNPLTRRAFAIGIPSALDVC